MAKTSLTIAIGGEYNGAAIGKAKQDLESLQSTAAKSMGGVSSSLVEAGEKYERVGSTITAVGSKMESVGNKATVGITMPIVAAGAATVAAAVEMDTSLTNVRKTVDGTEEQYQGLKQAAIEFSKTNAVSASQILDIQALGAQLGFSIEELQEFGEVVSGLDIATNMDAETAATEMAQFANITKMSHDEVRRYGSTIVDLGNNMATTESDISHMAMRLAAAGTQVGMSQADILGLAASLSSLGVEAEAGGTAISTIMSRIDADVARASMSWDDWAASGKETEIEIVAAMNSAQSAMELWADAAGVSAEEFAEAWRNDPAKALASLLSGMEDATYEGSNMTIMLDDLGISSIRQTDIMKRMAGNSELVANAVDLANNAWEENTALQAEVDNRNNSMAAKFEMLKNKVTAVAESVGTPLVDALLDVVDAAEPLIENVADLARQFADMDEEDQRMILGLVSAAAAFGPVLSITGKLTKGVGSLVSAFGKGTKQIGLATSGVKSLSKEQLKAITSADKAKASMEKLGASSDTAAKKTKALGDSAKGAAGQTKELGDKAKAAGTQTKTLGDNAKAAATNVKAVGDNTKTAATNAKSLGDNAKTAAANTKALGDNTKAAATSTKTLGDNVKAAASSTETLGKQAGTAKANVKELSTNLGTAGKNSSTVSTNMQTAATHTEKLGTTAGVAKTNVKDLAVHTEAVGTNAKVTGGYIDTVNQRIVTFDQAAGNAKSNVKGLGDAAAGAKDGINQSAEASKKLGDNAQAASKGTGALRGGMELLDGICKTAAIGLAVGLVGDLVGQFMAYQEHAQLVEDATKGLESAFGSIGNSWEVTSDSLKTVETDIEGIALSAEECLRQQAGLAEKARTTWSDVNQQKGELQYYLETIDELRDKTGLTAGEQERLKLAVEGYNEITGDNLQVIDQQNGRLDKTKEAIEGVSKAWMENAKIEAIRELWSESYKQMVADSQSLEEAQRKLQEADEGIGLWLGDFAVFADPASVEYQKLATDVDNLTAALGSATDMHNYLSDLLDQVPSSFVSFEDALDAVGVKIEDFGDLSEEELNQLKEDFNGSLGSIVNSCINHGREIPESLANGMVENQRAATEQAHALGMDVDAGVAKGMDDNQDVVQDSTTNLWDSICNWFCDLFQIHSPSRLMAEYGADIDQGLANGITDNTDKPAHAMGNMSDEIKNKIDGLPNTLYDIGKDAGSRAASGLDSERGSVSTAAKSLDDSAQNGIRGVIEGYNTIAKDSASRFAGTIGSSSAYNEGQKLASTGEQGLASVKTDTAGHNFAVGFGNGMQGVDLWSIAWNVGMSALNAIKSALGIASPSKEARIVGEFFGQGAAIGIEQSSKSVVDSAYAVGVDAADALQDGLSTSSIGITANPLPYTTQDVRAMASGTPNNYVHSATIKADQTQRPYESHAQNIVVNMNITVKANNANEASGIGKTLGEELYAEMARKMRGL